MKNPKQLKARYPYMFNGENIGLDISRGWFPLFSRLCEEIDALLAGDKRGFHWTQLKEKFGSGRFYWAMKGRSPQLHVDFMGSIGISTLVKSGSARARENDDTLAAIHDQVAVLVRDAAQATRTICIVCGEAAALNQDDSWMLVLCERHAQQRREGTLEPTWFGETER